MKLSRKGHYSKQLHKPDSIIEGKGHYSKQLQKPDSIIEGMLHVSYYNNAFSTKLKTLLGRFYVNFIKILRLILKI